MKLSLASCQRVRVAHFADVRSQDGCSGVPKDGSMASHEKIYSDPLLVEITWHTNTQPYECGSEK